MVQKKFDRQIFRINFGYRALLDWGNSSDWMRGVSARNVNDRSQAGPQSRGTGTLRGPIVFGGAQRPRKNFWGQTDTSAYVRGFKGFYYDVHHSTPSGSPPRGEWSNSSIMEDVQANIEDVVNELDAHSQQWLYLAAEAMAAKGQTLVDRGKVAQEEIDRVMSLVANEQDDQLKDDLFNTLMHEPEGGQPSAINSKGVYKPKPTTANEQKFHDTDDKALKGMGGAMSRGSGTFPTSFGRLKFGGGPTLLETYDEEAQEAFNKQPRGPMTDTTNLTSPTAGEKQFRTMLLGVQGQWINAFASNVVKNGDKEIKRLAKTVEDHVEKYATLYGGTLDYGDKLYGPREQSKIEQFSSEGMTTGGQTVQEFAAIQAGIATGEYGVAGMSKAIDLRFKEEVKFLTKEGEKSAGHRMDVTTEFFRDSFHHGVGRVGKKGVAMQGAAETTKDIEDFYNTDRIPKYNALINLILEATGYGGASPQSLWAARQDIGGVKTAFANLKKNQLNPKTTKKGINAITVLGLYDTLGEELLDDLTWVLHHMGNMLTDDATDPYSNMMPIEIMGPNNTGPYVGTLFLVFSLFSDTGLYKKMGPDGSYVYIEDAIPMEWLYNRAHDAGWQGEFEEFADMGSAAIVEHALTGTLQSGTMVKLAVRNPEQRLIYAKISAPDFENKLKNVSDKLFESIGEELGKNLDKKIHDDAVKYSMQMRNPSQLANVKKWFDFGVDYLMTKSAASAKAADIWSTGSISNYKSGKMFTEDWAKFGIAGTKRTDPFWYLWAAPYVTRSRPRIGGSVTGIVSER